MAPVTKKVFPKLSPRASDPFMRPEWRWNRVLAMCDDPDGPKRTTKRDDKYIRAARSFLLRWRAGSPWDREQLMYDSPGMYHAYRIFDHLHSDPNVAFVMEAMLLANYPYDEIGDATKTDPDVVEHYEAVFFNVVPYLRHYNWVLTQVLIPAANRFVAAKGDAPKPAANDNGFQRFVTPPVIEPHMDSTLKWLSYYGGPQICEFVLSGFKRGLTCNTQDDIGDWLDEQYKNQLRCRSTQSIGVFEVNRYNVTELFQLHMEVIKLAAGVDGQENKQTTMEKHIHAMLTEIPWTVGMEAKAVFEGTTVGRYDEMAAELRDEELLLVGAGDKCPDLDELPGLVMPTGIQRDKEIK